MNRGDLRERDFVRLVVIITIVVLVVGGVLVFSAFNAGTTVWGPMDVPQS